MRDLSIITDTLRGILTGALAADAIWGNGPPPFSVGVSGQHPSNPSTSDCELSLYLFHVGPDKYAANSFWTQAAQSGGGVGKQPVAFEPLCLDLWYMLSAQAKTSFVHEQQVLGVAMQAFHEHGTFAIPTPTPPPNPVAPSQATLILESPTFDELSRLWQALGLPLRTTAQYRVSVVFLSPDAIPAAALPVTAVNMVAAPGTPPADASLPRLLSTRRTVAFVAPGPTPNSYEQSPASTAPAPTAIAGQDVVLDALMLAATDQLLLVSHAGGVTTETDVSATWKKVPPYGSPPADGVPFLVRAPAGSPVPPGRYELTVARPGIPGFRATPVPLSVAAWVDPAGGPLLHPVGSTYALDVRNVPASGAFLRLGAVPLVRVADGSFPGAGQWQCSGGKITFVAPAGIASGHHKIGLRVSEVESDPALWAVV